MTGSSGTDRGAGATEAQRRAWGWVAHLRDGGTTPWSGWATPAEPTDRALPGAAQLELLRRMNLTGPTAETLQRSVFDASAPGRGIPDLELVGAASESPFGPRPVDPGDLPDAELLRVAAGLVAELLVATAAPAGSAPDGSSRRPRWWRRRYRLVGDPRLTHSLRAVLTADGRPPGGRAATVLVLGDSLDRMLADAWEMQCFDAGALPWVRWLRTWEVRRSGLPRAVDLPRLAQGWAVRVGPQRVRHVLDLGAVPKLVGTSVAGVPPPLPADAVELARRVAATLAPMVPAPERPGLLAHGLRPRLRAEHGLPVSPPQERWEWVERRAHEMSRAIAAGDYPVHGRPDAVLPRTPGASHLPTDAGTLAVAVRLLKREEPA